MVRNQEPANPSSFPQDDSPVEILEQSKQLLAEEYQAKVRQIDQAITKLKGQGNGRSPIAPGMFAGASIKDAMIVYLNLSGGKAKVSEIQHALEVGGCALGQFADRNIAITISNNKKQFSRDEHTDTITLIKGK